MLCRQRRGGTTFRMADNYRPQTSSSRKAGTKSSKKSKVTETETTCITSTQACQTGCPVSLVHFSQSPS